MNPLLLAEAATGGKIDPTHLFATTLFIAAAAMFILSLKWLSAPHTARRGNYAGQIGMLLAVVGALLQYHVITYNWIIVGFVEGIILVAATQRPSADVIPTRLRDIFGYRAAFRCTTDSSSDIILSNLVLTLDASSIVIVEDQSAYFDTFVLMAHPKSVDTAIQ